MLKCIVTQHKFQGTDQTGQGDGTDKRPRHRSRKSEMIIIGSEEAARILQRYTMCQDVMNCLYIKRLLDFGIGGSEMVDLDNHGEEDAQSIVYNSHLSKSV